MCRAKTGNPCQFPFTYKGREYNTCITNDHTDVDGKGVAWCYLDQEEGLWKNKEEICKWGKGKCA